MYDCFKIGPCPFCAGRGRIRKTHPKKPIGYQVICSECGARTATAYVEPWHDNVYIAQGKVVKMWNRRAGGGR